MKKNLLTSLLALFVVIGVASLSAASTPYCSGSSSCPMDQGPSCAYKVLTKKECHRFCKAKADVIAANSSLAHKDICFVCDAIIKRDPSMESICTKVKKYCDDTHRCTDPVCKQASKKASTSASK